MILSAFLTVYELVWIQNWLIKIQISWWPADSTVTAVSKAWSGYNGTLSQCIFYWMVHIGTMSQCSHFGNIGTNHTIIYKYITSLEQLDMWHVSMYSCKKCPNVPATLFFGLLVITPVIFRFGMQMLVSRIFKCWLWYWHCSYGLCLHGTLHSGLS